MSVTNTKDKDIKYNQHDINLSNNKDLNVADLSLDIIDKNLLDDIIKNTILQNSSVKTKVSNYKEEQNKKDKTNDLSNDKKENNINDKNKKNNKKDDSEDNNTDTDGQNFRDKDKELREQFKHQISLESQNVINLNEDEINAIIEKLKQKGIAQSNGLQLQKLKSITKESRKRG